MSFRAFQSYTPRPLPLRYDALAIEYGCTDAVGAQVESLNAFSQICVFPHSAASYPHNLSEQISVALGPTTENTVNSPYRQAWMAWVATAGVRYGKGNTVVLPNNAGGAALSLFPTSKPAHLTFAFDAAARTAAAISLTATGAVLKYHTDNTTVATLALTATTPVLLFTGLLNNDPTRTNELALLFLRPAHPHRLYGLFQSDGFVTEHVLMDDIRVPLSALLRAGTTEDNRFALYARTPFGDDVTLKTDPYALAFPDGLDEIDVLLSQGGYFDTAKIAANQSDNGKVNLLLSDGDYLDVIVDLADVSPIDPEAATLTVTLAHGSYA